MKFISRLYYNFFPKYQRLEVRFVTYNAADILIRANTGKPPEEQWVLAKEEDVNTIYGMVWIERRKRITE